MHHDGQLSMVSISLFGLFVKRAKCVCSYLDEMRKETRKTTTGWHSRQFSGRSGMQAVEMSKKQKGEISTAWRTRVFYVTCSRSLSLLLGILEWEVTA